MKQKKSGETCSCADYQKLKSGIVKNSWLGSNIKDILTYLNSARYFLSLEMYSGYWHVKEKEECKLFTA